MVALLEALIKEGLITEEQLKEAREKQVGAKRPIQELLAEMGFVKEDDLIKVSSDVFNMPISHLDKESIDTSLTKAVSYEVAKQHGVFPVRKENNTLILAMSNPRDIMALDSIKAIANMDIKPILCTKSEISLTIEKYYQSDETLYDLLKNIVTDTKLDVVIETKGQRSNLELEALKAGQSPVVRVVNLVLAEAVKARASDIHIEPGQDSFGVRYRIDGDLRNITELSAKIFPSFINCIKILAELDIAETRKPQDGRISLSLYGRNIDLRISTVPTHYGEKAVMRLLDPEESKIQLDKIGFAESEINLFKEAITRPQGMFLVTGPTGSGKTSTIYAALNFIKNSAKNIITIEDPIEYLVDGITQIQINPVKDVTFANGLRSILRQDPDVILVGEIRDKETADIAIRSSLTGHLVFSTLHTNNSVASITRLLDIGLEPYLISSSIILIVAQRLIKLICPHCKEEYSPAETIIKKLSIYLDKYKVRTYYRGRGCDKCSYVGFYGRTAIFEILSTNERLRSLISDGATEDQIFREAKNFGVVTLAESGIKKVAEGITTIEEVMKVVDVVEEREFRQQAKEGKVKILVTDDDKLIRKMVIDAFSQEQQQYEFLEAENGSQAIKLVYETRPDILISDLMMPRMDGFEVVKYLRSHLETASLPIVMLTSKSDKQSEIEGLDLGADDYITKPFDKDRLRSRVKMLLKRKI